MAILSRRNAAPLLRIVNGKPHATDIDHVHQLPTPPGTNNSSRSTLHSPACAMAEELTRSPVSSEDEMTEKACARKQLPAKRMSFQTPRQIDEKGNGVVKSAPFRRPRRPPSSPHSERSKRPRDDDAGTSSDGDGIFGPERTKKSKPSGFANIHALTRRKKEKQYGSKSQARVKTSRFQKREDEAKIVEPPRPKFQRARGVDDDVFEFGNDEPMSSAGFRSAGLLKDAEVDATVLRDRGSLSPSLSSLSPEPSSPIMVGMQPTNTAASSSTTCPICSEVIPTEHITSFQQSFTKSSPILNYRWQQRFCRWHKQQDARRLSTERGYPEIDWNRLPERMQKSERHLRRVIKGEERSFHRDQLAEVLGNGAHKTTLGALAADGETQRGGAGCGYYGPKGERVLTDHIISHLSAEIRRQSTCDRLVAAAGVSGGVSGFVQAVLVPQLAERLICDDMKVERERAREIMLESAEIGELLHPDANDSVSQVDGMDE